MKRNKNIVELTEPETFSRIKYCVQKMLGKNVAGEIKGIIYIKERQTGKSIFRTHSKAKIVYTKNTFKVDPTKKEQNIQIRNRSKYKKQIPAWKYMSKLERRRYIFFKEKLLSHVKNNAILTKPRIYFMYLSLITEYDIPFLGFNIKVRAIENRIRWSLRRI